MIKIRDNCKFDLISLGEVMLRLDPGEGRVRNARRFDVWEGGGEYNVAHGLRKCFGMNTAVVTALADNDVGRLIEDLILRGGVCADFIQWRKFDGIGRNVRNGLNFVERGFGLRGAKSVSDRGNSAASQLKPGDVDWDKVFESAGWLHTGGIFSALSESSARLAVEAVKAAKKHGVTVSYDLNYRASLWREIGGQPAARRINREIAQYVDVMIGNEEDFTACLGFEVENSDLKSLNVDAYAKMVQKVSREYPNLSVIATTLRTVRTATVNDWSAVGWFGGELFQGMTFDGLEIFDRVGGGDSFASGLIYGLLTGKNGADALNYGIAHGALAMTTPGDTSMADKSEVDALLNGAGARIER